jgi:hypothetical protein
VQSIKKASTVVTQKDFHKNNIANMGEKLVNNVKGHRERKKGRKE